MPEKWLGQDAQYLVRYVPVKEELVNEFLVVFFFICLQCSDHVTTYVLAVQNSLFTIPAINTWNELLFPFLHVTSHG